MLSLPQSITSDTFSPHGSKNGNTPHTTPAAHGWQVTACTAVRQAKANVKAKANTKTKTKTKTYKAPRRQATFIFGAVEKALPRKEGVMSNHHKDRLCTYIYSYESPNYI